MTYRILIAILATATVACAAPENTVCPVMPDLSLIHI